MDEYRVQIGEKTRDKLKEYHLGGYWALIFGYHKNSGTFTAWDNKLLFSPNFGKVKRNFKSRQTLRHKRNFYDNCRCKIC